MATTKPDQSIPHNASPFLTALSSHQEQFLRPSETLHAATLALAKHYLDPVALSVSTLQLERLALERKSSSRKRRRRQEEAPLRLKSLAVEGFDAEQVWSQVWRILGAVEGEVGRVVGGEDETRVERVVEEDGSSEEEGEDEIDENSERVEDEELGEESVNEDEIDYDDDVMEDEESDEESEAHVPVQTLRKDKFGLNDGFFDIDEFNRRADMLESRDAVGEPDADAGSDEEDIEWEMDPALLKDQEAKDATTGQDEDDSEDGDDGPTFGNIDLYAPEGASEEEDGDEEDNDDAEAEAEGMQYKDFFDPPPGQGRPSTKKLKSSKKTPTDIDEDFEQNVERTMAAVHRDLYSDESDVEEEAEEENIPGASTHEKRKNALTAQIRELEALNVAKRPWAMSGEAGGKDRPVNAILEEHLDFERTGKPLPVITAETSEELEQLIKRRILAGEFDEVRRRRPDEALLSGTTRRGRQEEDNLENQPKRGLAEVYEEDHLRRTDAAYVDKKTEKLNKEHAEIESLWKDISTKLDSLASWRYRPKPTELSVSVRSDAPAMTMEDARPSGAGGEVGTLAQLAPQEVYKPGETKESGKVITKGGTVVDRAELSQENRKRQRRREKERIKKAQGQPNGDANNVIKQNSAKTLVGDLKKGGVQVIDRKGELRDVEGNEVKDGPRIHGSSLKL